MIRKKCVFARTSGESVALPVPMPPNPIRRDTLSIIERKFMLITLVCSATGVVCYTLGIGFGLYISGARISRRDMPYGEEVVATKQADDVTHAQPVRTVKESGLGRLFNLDVPKITRKAGGTDPSKSALTKRI